MRFAASGDLILLWIIPLLIFFFVSTMRSREKAMRRFADAHLLGEIGGDTSVSRYRAKFAFITLALLFSILALARPQWGYHWQEVKRKGLDILIALDTSKSMLAEDVKPNRLERAKLAIKDLISRLRGDRIGLIVFSGTAYLQCPLTLDYDGFLLTLDDVTVNSVPVGGTSISEAINTAARSYEGGRKKHKILIIITDGEDLEGGIDAAIQRAKASDITVYCVGIGSKEGELVPIKGPGSGMSFLKDQEGDLVKTKLNEQVLQKIAVETGGIYVKASGIEFGLDLIYNERLSKLEKQEFKSRMEKNYHERFQLALIPVIILLLIEPFIGYKKRGAS
jgi:Ca-activated chloride channel family protein